MRSVLLLLAASCAVAQTRDPATLLQDVADSVGSAHTWRMEGSIEERVPGGPPSLATFTFAMQSSGEMKLDVTGGPTPGVIACSASDSMTYSPPLHLFRRVSPPEAELCRPILGDWESLPDKLKSPKLGDYRPNGIGGRTPACQIVRGTTEPELPNNGMLKRELCIDTVQKTVVWETTENKYGKQTWMYTRIDRDVDLTRQDLHYDLPLGSKPTIYRLPLPQRIGAPQIPREPGVEIPRMRSHVDPEYDPASRKARVQGTVLLYVVIDANGRPSEIGVYRSLNPGLDAEAIKSVSQWRFYPAMKNNQPVPFASMIEVNFRLL